jgi:hypothetical protein
MRHLVDLAALGGEDGPVGRAAALTGEAAAD